MPRLSIAGDSKAIKVERSDQVRNAFGPPQVCSVTAPATDDGRGALARFHNVVIIQRTNRIRVLEHHLRVSRDQGEKIEHHEPLKAELLSEPQNSPQGRIELPLVRYRRVKSDPGCISFRSGKQIALIVIESISVFPAVAEDASVQRITGFMLSGGVEEAVSVFMNCYPTGLQWSPVVFQSLVAPCSSVRLAGT